MHPKGTLLRHKQTGAIVAFVDLPTPKQARVRLTEQWVEEGDTYTIPVGVPMRVTLTDYVVVESEGVG